jgi:hypothetical protein
MQVILSVHPWVIHRNADIFGADCDTYNPTRWLQGDTKRMDYFLIHVRSPFNVSLVHFIYSTY